MNKWQTPVQLTIPLNGLVRVDGPSVALLVLMDEWPNTRGPDYVRARSFCRAAIAGRKSAEEARAHFIEAAREANLIH